jgi:hypothetical protein
MVITWSRPDKPRKMCCQLARDDVRDIQCIHDIHWDSLRKFCDKVVIGDPTHPLHEHFQYLPSGRRLRMPAIRTTRFRVSAVPSGIRILNGQ